MPLAPENLDTSAVALFLDVDGTLLEIRDNPSEVVADRALTELLQACSKKVHGALSLISGRKRYLNRRPGERPRLHRGWL